MTRIHSVIAAGISTFGTAQAALTDTLDDLSNFGTPLNSTLTAMPGGVVSLTSDTPSVDRLVDWQIGGTIRLDLIDEGQVTVIPESQISVGEWGLWALYFTSSGSYVSEVNVLPYTDSASLVSFDMNDLAPPTAEEFVLRFRVREAIGDGFSFTEIRAVPEPKAAFLGSIGLAALFLRRRV